MMNIGIYANLSKDIGGRITSAILSILKPIKDLKINLSEELRVLSLDCDDYFSRNALAQNSEIIIVLGGDGTILRIAKECALYGTKIYAINLGNKGFLAEEDNYNLEAQIKSLFENNLIIDNRQLLEIVSKENKFYALNEVVLARGSRTKTMKCEVRVDGALVDRYTSDGVIISTPTGSTAYNISAGGPIVSPDVQALIITPICAHSLHSRPLVVKSNAKIWVSLIHAEPYAHLNIDGEDVINLADGDSIEVTKSEMYTSFIRKKDYNYFERLSLKMRKWSDLEIE